jgi:hypothetical protein
MKIFLNAIVFDSWKVTNHFKINFSRCGGDRAIFHGWVKERQEAGII